MTEIGYITNSVKSCLCSGLVKHPVTCGPVSVIVSTSGSSLQYMAFKCW